MEIGSNDIIGQLTDIQILNKVHKKMNGLLSKMDTVNGGVGKAENLISALSNIIIAVDGKMDVVCDILETCINPLEIIAKNALATGLNQILGCTIKNMTIPNWMREFTFYTLPGDLSLYTRDGNGFSFSQTDIDLTGKLLKNPIYNEEDISKSPRKVWDSMQYFGVDKKCGVFGLLRAKDFDAFLWFTAHKQRYIDEQTIDMLFGERTNTIFPNSTILKYETYGEQIDHTESMGVEIGTAFSYPNGNVLSICYNTTIEKPSSANDYTRKVTYAEVMPSFSRKSHSYTWRVIKTSKNNDPLPLFCLKSSNRSEYTDGLLAATDSSYTLKIKPKPFIHYSNRIVNDEYNPLQVGGNKILFNSNGEPDKNGCYSCFVSRCLKPATGTSTTAKYAISTNGSEAGEIGILKVNEKTNSYSVTMNEGHTVFESLYECYPSNTMFKFNIDYVNSMTFFDVKTIIYGTLANFFGNIGLEFTTRNPIGDEEIKDFVRRIIQKDYSATTDCYYTFDNTKYETLIQYAERRRYETALGVENEVDGEYYCMLKSLSDYDNANTEQKHDILTGVINTMVSINSNGVFWKTEDDSSFLEKILENLIMSFIMSLFTPKVMLAVALNEELVGEFKPDVSTDEFLERLSDLMVSISLEIKNYLLTKLWEYVLPKIKQIIKDYSINVLSDKALRYAELVKLLAENCVPVLNGLLDLFGRKIPSNLDIVNYSDIKHEIEEAPKNEC